MSLHFRFCLFYVSAFFMFHSERLLQVLYNGPRDSDQPLRF